MHVSPLDLNFKWYSSFDGGGDPATVVPQVGVGKANGPTGPGTGYTASPLFSITKEVRIPAVAAGANYSANLFDFSFLLNSDSAVKGYNGSLLVHDIYICQGRNATLENDFSSDPTTPATAANAIFRIRHDNPGGRGGEPATTDLCVYTTTDARINGIAHKWSAGMVHILPTLVAHDIDGANNPIARTVSFRIENTHGSTTISTGVYRVMLLCGAF